jgi:hypothetical protein
LAPMLKPL